MTEAEAAVEATVPVTLTAVKSRFAVLERVPTLFGLQPSQLRVLARRGRQTFTPKGTTVVTQGEPGQTMYVVLGGRCELSVSDAPGHSLSLALLGPGEAFGEEAAVLEEPRLASVRAVEDSDLLVLDRDAFVPLLGPDSDEMSELRRLVEQRKATARLLTAWAPAMNGAGSSQSIAFYSPKGGSGRTTVALNLAAQLARAHPAEVLLVDLSLPFNNAALMSNLVPVNSLAQLAGASPGQFEEALLSALLPHPAGFLVLSSAMRPEHAELVTPQLVERALDALKRSFRWLVFDLGPQLSDTTLSVLERADRVLLLTTPELSALKDIAELRRIFNDLLRIPPAKVMVALNHRGPKAAIGRADIERHLREELVCEFQFEGSKLDEAAIRGEVLSVADARSSMARATAAIAQALSGSKDGQPKASRRLFGIG